MHEWTHTFRPIFYRLLLLRSSIQLILLFKYCELPLTKRCDIRTNVSLLNNDWSLFSLFSLFLFSFQMCLVIAIRLSLWIHTMRVVCMICVQQTWIAQSCVTSWRCMLHAASSRRIGSVMWTVPVVSFVEFLSLMSLLDKEWVSILMKIFLITFLCYMMT